MGDRCYVEYHFAEGFGDLVERLFEAEDEFFGPGRIDGAENGIVTFVEEEVNYGDTSDVEEVLGRHAIPYDIEKGRGDEYDAVSVRARAVRNEEGDLYLDHREWYEGDNAIDIPELSGKLRREGISAVTALIKEREDYITVPPIKDAVLEPEHEALLRELSVNLTGRRARAAKDEHSAKWLVQNREVYDQGAYERDAVLDEDAPIFRLGIEDDWETVTVELQGSDGPSLSVQTTVLFGVPAVLIGDVGQPDGCVAVYRVGDAVEVVPLRWFDEPEASQLPASFGPQAARPSTRFRVAP